MGTAMDLGGWLRNLGLERYEAAFRENEINERVLPSLTQEDLKEIGVGPVGLPFQNSDVHQEKELPPELPKAALCMRVSKIGPRAH